MHFTHAGRKKLPEKRRRSWSGEIELKKKAEHEKEEELACEKELVELIKQET